MISLCLGSYFLLWMLRHMGPLCILVDVQCSYPLNLRGCCIVWSSVLTAVYMLLAHGQCLSLTSLLSPPQFSHTYHFSFFLMCDIPPCMSILWTSTFFVFHCMYDLHTHMCIDSYMYVSGTCIQTSPPPSSLDYNEVTVGCVEDISDLILSQMSLKDLWLVT